MPSLQFVFVRIVFSVALLIIFLNSMAVFVSFLLLLYSDFCALLHGSYFAFPLFFSIFILLNFVLVVTIIGIWSVVRFVPMSVSMFVIVFFYMFAVIQ